jgi:large subunit ribosomal protein L2
LLDYNLLIYLKFYKPVIPSQRIKRQLKPFLFKKKFFSNLQIGAHSMSGRNYSGSIVTRHRQKGSKNNRILVDFTRRLTKQYGVCVGFILNKRISTFTALIKHANGIYSYILAPHGLFYGDLIKNSHFDGLDSRSYRLGYSVSLFFLPANSLFFNLELKPYKGAQYSRAAGTYCLISKVDLEKNLFTIKLPTGKLIIVSGYCSVTLGRSSNILHKKSITGKAGLNRLLGKRPTVRGVAMNPVDHPHGGRTKTSSPEVTPWGKVAKKNK